MPGVPVRIRLIQRVVADGGGGRAGILMHHAGNWDGGTTYAPGDVVHISGGQFWVAIVASTGVDPTTDDGTHWVGGDF